MDSGEGEEGFRFGPRVGYAALMGEGQADTTVGSTKPALVGRPWRPGQSGNPSGANGKQKGLATLVRRSTKQGRELVAFMLDVARGAPIKMSVTTVGGTVLDVERRATVADRMEAVRWLADRGWGKAREVIRLEDEGGRQGPLLVFLSGGDEDPLAPLRRPVRALPASMQMGADAPVPVRPAVSVPEVVFDMDQTEPPGG